MYHVNILESVEILKQIWKVHHHQVYLNLTKGKIKHLYQS